jgi:hypothetical protein
MSTAPAHQAGDLSPFWRRRVRHRDLVRAPNIKGIAQSQRSSTMDISGAMPMDDLFNQFLAETSGKRARAQ